MLAQSFVAEGYDVIILDVVWGALAQLYRQLLAAYPHRIVKLMPTWEKVLKRLHDRPHTITNAEAKWVYDTQVSLIDFDFELDNSAISAEDVAAWLASLPESP